MHTWPKLETKTNCQKRVELSDPHCYRQWVYTAPFCITLRIKTWVVAYLKFITIFLRIFKKKFNFILCNFSVRLLKCFWKKHFCPQKIAQKNSNSLFSLLLLLPWLPNRPKQKDSCSKMWLKEQLSTVYRTGNKATQWKNYDYVTLFVLFTEGMYYI